MSGRSLAGAVLPGGQNWVREAAFGLALTLGAAFIAVALVDARLQRLLLLGLAAVALALVIRFPFFFTCLALALVGSVLAPGRFKVPAGPIELRLEELLFGALIIAALVRPRRDWWGGRAGQALFVFLGVLVASATLAFAAGRVDFGNLYSASRTFAPVLLFFVVVRLFPDPGQVRRVLLVAVVLAALTGVVSVLAAAPGSPISTFLNPEGTSAIRDNEGFGLVNRVRLPGVALAYGLFWYAAVQAAVSRDRERMMWLVLLAGMSVSLALSFNRNMWVGLALGLVLMLAFSRRSTRQQVSLALVGLLAAGAATALSGTSVSATSPLYPIVERGATLADPSREVNDSSLQDRARENEAATKALRQSPLVGVGPGAPYGKIASEPSSSGQEIRTYQRFIHNQYLQLLLIGGPLALLSFLGFLGTPLLSGLRARAADDTLLALSIGLTLVLVSAIVMLTFADPTFLATNALLAAGLVVLTSHRAAGSQADEPSRVP